MVAKNMSEVYASAQSKLQDKQGTQKRMPLDSYADYDSYLCISEGVGRPAQKGKAAEAS